MFLGVPGGVRFKSKSPFRYASADRRGFMQAVHRRFNVISACWMILFHKWREKFVSQIKSPAMSWTLKVWIYLYAISDWCNLGVTSFRVAPDSLVISFVRSDHWLSSMFSHG